jgi:hypothetical protein
MRSLFAPERPGPVALVLLALAAVAVLVGGYYHARLFHRGYAEVDVVGPLFLLNGIASLVVVLFLIVDRVRLFVLGSLAVSVGSLVSILISHSSSFFGFAEGTYDSSATVIVVAEIVATVLTVVGGALAIRRPAATAGPSAVTA